jgi:hypothetical protein
MRGSGTTRLADPAAGGSVAAMPGDTEIPWKAGDLFTLPALSRATHIASTDAALYWVHDEPLLRYLGVEATRQQFPATLYAHEAIREALEAVLHDPASAKANRLSVLLGHRLFPQTMTITHVLWAMFGVLPVGAVQAPHRHQSVAVDLVVDAKPGCYTLAAAFGLRDAARPLAFPPQRVGPPSPYPADPGCRAAHLPADAQHPLQPADRRGRQRNRGNRRLTGPLGPQNPHKPPSRPQTRQFHTDSLPILKSGARLRTTCSFAA